MDQQPPYDDVAPGENKWRDMVIRNVAMMLIFIFASPALSAPPCFDLAVIAESPTYRWLPIDPPIGDDEIILSRPARVTFTIEKILLGSYAQSTIRVETSLHGSYNPKIRHYLLLLKKQSGNIFGINDMETYVVQLTNGEYAMPLDGPLDDEWLEAESFISADYQERLEQLHYAASEAWWHDPDDVPDEQERLRVSPWTEIRHGRVTLPRGLKERTLTDMMRPLRCPRE